MKITSFLHFSCLNPCKSLQIPTFPGLNHAFPSFFFTMFSHYQSHMSIVFFNFYFPTANHTCPSFFLLCFPTTNHTCPSFFLFFFFPLSITHVHRFFKIFFPLQITHVHRCFDYVFPTTNDTFPSFFDYVFPLQINHTCPRFLLFFSTCFQGPPRFHRYFPLFSRCLTGGKFGGASKRSSRGRKEDSQGDVVWLLFILMKNYRDL